MPHRMRGLFSQHWPPLKRQPLGGRDCVLFILISPTPNTELASLGGCTYTFSFACAHTSACERDVQGACPWVSTHSSSVHVESTMGGMCSCVSDRVGLSAGWHSCVCGCENTRVLPSLPHQLLHPLHLWSQRFSPRRWEVLLMGTKSRHDKSYSFSQESVLLSPSSSPSYFTSLPSSLQEEAHLSSAFADMAIWAH